ncbi:hypothetical protein JHK84_045504 [Glycine max]|nr:hypothetical protein JHK84_045504 [Glycine max]
MSTFTKHVYKYDESSQTIKPLDFNKLLVLHWTLNLASGDVIPTPTSCENCQVTPPPSGYPFYEAPPPPSQPPPPSSGYSIYGAPPPPSPHNYFTPLLYGMQLQHQPVPDPLLLHLKRRISPAPPPTPTSIIKETRPTWVDDA